MNINIKCKAIDCFRYIKNVFPNSYLAEDNQQIIIGINAVYLDSEKYSYEDIRKFIKTHKGIADCAGLFGVFSYEIIHYFEKIPQKENSEYFYPEFVFADAGAYLRFDKKNSVYDFFGDSRKYSDLLHYLQGHSHTAKSGYNTDFRILGNEKEKKRIFLENTAKAKEYIKNGDIFQVVLSSQIILESNLDPYDFYTELAEKNPSPYMFFFPYTSGTYIG